MNLKKLTAQLFAVVTLSIGSLATYAQDRIYYTINTGVTISSFNQETAPFPDPSLVVGFEKANRTSLEVGGDVNYLLSDVFSFSGGLRYAEKGGSYKTKNPDFIYVSNLSGAKVDDAYNYLRYRLVYMEIPVLAKINVFKLFDITADQQDLNLYGGVSGMLNIGSKIRNNKFSSDGKESWEAESLKGAEDFLLSWVAGVEWFGGPFIIYGRYTRNIGSIYDTTVPGYENFNVDMGTLSLGLGFIIN